MAMNLACSLSTLLTTDARLESGRPSASQTTDTSKPSTVNREELYKVNYVSERTTRPTLEFVPQPAGINIQSWFTRSTMSLGTIACDEEELTKSERAKS